jgi:predicted RNA polymerase sigma factor
VRDTIDHLFRHQAGRMVSRLARLLGPAQLDLAEETVQEAMLRALQTWPYQGVPENARGSVNYQITANPSAETGARIAPDVKASDNPKTAADEALDRATRVVGSKCPSG